MRSIRRSRECVGLLASGEHEGCRWSGCRLCFSAVATRHGAAAARLPVALVSAFVNVDAARVARLRFLASQMGWGETSDE